MELNNKSKLDLLQGNFADLEKSTKLYLVAAIFSLLGMLSFDPTNIGSVTSRFYSFLNLFAATFVVLSFIFFYSGVYKSFKDLRNVRRLNKLKLSELLGYICFVMVYSVIINYSSTKTYVLFSVVYILFVRLIKKYFIK